MDANKWLLTDWTSVGITIASGVILLILMIIIVRIIGLSSFAKMSNVDFASTVAIGSILAATVLNDQVAVLNGALSILVILVFQRIMSAIKRRSRRFEAVVENEPVALMVNGEILEDNMRASGITRGNLVAKLREANVIHVSEVKVVVLETTGDISVLHGSEDKEVDDLVMEGVII